MSYQPPVREHLFLLRDVLEIEKYANLPGFADASLDVVEQILDEAAQVLRRGAGAAEPRRRQARLHLDPGQHGHDAARLQGRLQAVGRGRLAGAGRRSGSTAARACRR